MNDRNEDKEIKDTWSPVPLALTQNSVAAFVFTMVCDRRLCVFTRPASGTVWLIGIISILMLIGCATRLPGGDTSYSIEAYYNKALQRMEARYDYGRYRGRYLGSNSGIASFTEYHTLVARWKSEDGQRKEHQVDIGPLIEVLKEREKGWFPTGWSEIQFRYKEPLLHINLEITTRSHPIQYYNYPLYQFEMR